MKWNTCEECRYWSSANQACLWAPPVENRKGFSLLRRAETPACREFRPIPNEEGFSEEKYRDLKESIHEKYSRLYPKGFLNFINWQSNRWP